MEVHRSPMHRSIPFPTTPAVPSVGFGFNLLHQASISASPPPRSSPLTPSRQLNSNKRRHEPDAEQEDESMMARSPSPMDRPKKALTKRVRVEVSKSSSQGASGKPATESTESVDVGMLLASLPPASHLTILTSLISKHPGLKGIILPLIPRPTIDAAVQAINAAAKKIRDAHPYSQPSPPSIGFGFGFGGSQPSRTGISFGSASTSSSSGPSSKGGTSGMRDGYVQNRLRPVVAEFASTSRSYLSYFTSETSTQQHPATSSHSPPSQSVSELAHPAETFTYLHTLTLLIMRLSSQARGLIVREHDTLLFKVQAEWRAWLDRIDAHVNRSGGMYGSETARTWERGLDELVALEHETPPLAEEVDQSSTSGSRTRPQQQQRNQQQQQQHSDRPMRMLRDAWVAKVGWLIGRRLSPDQFGMDEDEDL